MKKIYALLFVLPCLQGLCAQEGDYRPIVENGKTWVTEVRTQLDFLQEQRGVFKTTQVTGDTVVGGLVCKKVRDEVTGKTYAMTVDDEKGRVFCIPPGETEPHLLYDFGLKENETATIYIPTIEKDVNLKIMRQSTIFNEGRIINALYYTVLPDGNGGISLVNEENSGIWLEGIGDASGLLNTGRSAFTNIGASGYDLVLCKDRNGVLYHTRRYVAPDDTQLPLDGYIKDQDGQPVSNATVTFTQQGQTEGYSAQTNDDGYYKTLLPIDNPYYCVRVSAEGCAPYEMRTARDITKLMPYPEHLPSDFYLVNRLHYEAQELASIILPVEPDPTAGKYYAMEKYADGKLIFKQETSPEANTPYLFIPHQDYTLSLQYCDFSATPQDVQIDGTKGAIVFKGGYCNTDRLDKMENYLSWMPDEERWPVGAVESIAEDEIGYTWYLGGLHAAVYFTKEDFNTTGSNLLPFIVLQDATPFDPLFSEGKTWQLDYLLANNEYLLYEFSVSKESLIDGIQFWNLLESYHTAEAESVNHSELVANYLVGEQDGKLYFSEKDYPSSHLFMDFSLAAGSSLDFPHPELDQQIHLDVTAVSDTVLASSEDLRSRRCLYVSYDSPYYGTENDVWVEGIGSLKYGITFPFLFGATGGIPSLWKCTDNETVLYAASDNPSSIEPVQTITSSASFVFDLQGRRLATPPARGIFIQGGKKLILK